MNSILKLNQEILHMAIAEASVVRVASKASHGILIRSDGVAVPKDTSTFRQAQESGSSQLTHDPIQVRPVERKNPSVSSTASEKTPDAARVPAVSAASIRQPAPGTRSILKSTHEPLRPNVVERKGPSASRVVSPVSSDTSVSKPERASDATQHTLSMDPSAVQPTLRETHNIISRSAVNVVPSDMPVRTTTQVRSSSPQTPHIPVHPGPVERRDSVASSIASATSSDTFVSMDEASQDLIDASVRTQSFAKLSIPSYFRILSDTRYHNHDDHLALNVAGNDTVQIQKLTQLLKGPHAFRVNSDTTEVFVDNSCLLVSAETVRLQQYAYARWLDVYKKHLKCIMRMEFKPFQENYLDEYFKKLGENNPDRQVWTIVKDGWKSYTKIDTFKTPFPHMTLELFLSELDALKLDRCFMLFQTLWIAMEWFYAEMQYLMLMGTWNIDTKPSNIQVVMEKANMTVTHLELIYYYNCTTILFWLQDSKSKGVIKQLTTQVMETLDTTRNKWYENTFATVARAFNGSSCEDYFEGPVRHLYNRHTDLIRVAPDTNKAVTTPILPIISIQSETAGRWTASIQSKLFPGQTVMTRTLDGWEIRGNSHTMPIPVSAEVSELNKKLRSFIPHLSIATTTKALQNGMIALQLTENMKSMKWMLQDRIENKFSTTGGFTLSQYEHFMNEMESIACEIALLHMHGCTHGCISPLSIAAGADMSLRLFNFAYAVGAIDIYQMERLQQPAIGRLSRNIKQRMENVPLFTALATICLSDANGYAEGALTMNQRMLCFAALQAWDVLCFLDTLHQVHNAIQAEWFTEEARCKISNDLQERMAPAQEILSATDAATTWKREQDLRKKASEVCMVRMLPVFQSIRESVTPV